MKGNQVKSEFKIHRSVLFFDKNIDNYLKNKYLISLGSDDIPSNANVQEGMQTYILKIWEFINLENYYSDQSGFLGGSYWDKADNQSKGMTVPTMFKLESTDPIKKFTVSKDMLFACMVTGNNQIYLYQVSLFILTLTFCLASRSKRAQWTIHFH